VRAGGPSLAPRANAAILKGPAREQSRPCLGGAIGRKLIPDGGGSLWRRQMVFAACVLVLVSCVKAGSPTERALYRTPRPLRISRLRGRRPLRQVPRRGFRLMVTGSTREI
jgi:hypothetical protein